MKSIFPSLSQWASILVVTCMVGIHARAEPIPTREELLNKAEAMFGDPKNATRLVPDGRVWVDGKRGLVIVDGYVTLRKGQLEMLACPTGTKEHESIIAVFAAARHVHAGLLAAGAEQGAPTQFEPYRPATGTTIKISALYRDAEGKNHLDPAQKWIRRMGTNKEMPYDWVFAGSGFYKDVDSGEQRYLGDSGDLICVANFPTATMDLAVESAAANSGLVFEAFTENIPPMHTLVRLVLKVSDAEPSRESDVEPGIQLPPAKPAAGSTEKQTPENKADSKTDAKAIAPETQEKTPKASDQDISLEEMIPSIESRKKPETK
ncbi:MAG: YdjY domain-containing protein [Planctomycetota bacterium]|nr:YdjY domain-containing protein [Planctomycetota bacterium]